MWVVLLDCVYDLLGAVFCKELFAHEFAVFLKVLLIRLAKLGKNKAKLARKGILVVGGTVLDCIL